MPLTESSSAQLKSLRQESIKTVTVKLSVRRDRRAAFQGS